MLSRLFSRPRAKQDDPRSDGLVRVPFLKQAGMLVSHDTALRYSAVFACIRAIAEPLSMLPWRVYRDTSSGGKTIVTSSPVDRLLHRRPNPEMSAMAFRETLIGWALTWGNGYAEIERDMVGRIAALWPISPDRVEPMRDDSGALVYKVSGTGEAVIIPASDMYHLHGLGFDGLTGYSILSLARKAIGVGLASEEFGASFFANNTVLGGVLEHPGSLSDAAYDRLKNEFTDQHQGPGRSHKPEIFEEGMKWHQLGIPPNDAQFLETRQHQVEDIARWFGVKPHKIGLLDRSIKANIESQNIEMVVDTLQPWATRIEQEADAKLFTRRNSSFFTKLNLKALLRGDSAARAQYYKELSALGALSVNEIIELEDGNPIGDVGQKRIVPMNMTTLDRVGEESETEPGEPMADPDEETARQPFENRSIPSFVANSLTVALSYESRDYRQFVHSGNTVDHEQLTEWLNGYYAKHRPSITAQLSRSAHFISAFSETISGPEDMARTLRDYVDWHIEQSKQSLSGVFTGERTIEDFETGINLRVEEFLNRFTPRIIEA